MTFRDKKEAFAYICFDNDYVNNIISESFGLDYEKIISRNDNDNLSTSSIDIELDYRIIKCVLVMNNKEIDVFQFD